MNIFLKVFVCLSVIISFLIKCTSHKKEELKSLIPGFVKDSVYLSGENIFTEEKAALGRYLFYDRRLSVNNTKACASCHAQEFSFTDSYTRSIGALGDLHQRNTKPFINIVFEKYLTAADSTIHFPEEQISKPMFNEHPVEMGIKGNENLIIDRIRQDAYYNSRFQKLYPAEKEPVNITNIQFCISSFIKTIFSFNSSFDNYYYRGDKTAINSGQLSGMKLFFSTRLNCSSCHGGINFSRPLLKNKEGITEFYFNTGLYNLDSQGSYPDYDQGLVTITKKNADKGKYKIPTLRNLSFTAPYFHEGSAATLEEVIEVYENGGRNILTGENKGDGRMNPNKHPLIKEFNLNSQERKDLVSFLLSLSDSSVLTNPAYANPFSDDETKKKHYP